MLVYVLSLIFLILFTVRKLDVRRRQAEEFPEVPGDRFEAWQSYESRAYSLGAWACFLRLVVGYAFERHALSQGLPPWMRLVGLGIDVSWTAALVVTFVKRGRARKMREALGIDLSRKPRSASGG